MKKLQSNYPIGQFFLEIITSSGMEINDFLEAIGYTNPARGIRHLKDFLREGLGPGVFIERIMGSSFAPCRNALAFVAQQTKEQIDYEWGIQDGISPRCKKLDFRPFLHAVPAAPEVSSVSMVSSSGFFEPYCIFVTYSLTSLPEQAHNKKIGKIIRQNYCQNNGEIDCLGAIGYYLFYRAWGEPPIAFSVEGEPLGVADTAFLPKAETPAVNRRIDDQLIKRLVNSRGYDPIQ